MSRRTRIEFPGALCHVINRGNNKCDIFLDEQDFNVFLKMLKEVKEEDDFILHCYCLMPNHFHLLVEIIEKPLSKIMQKILTSYAIYFNSKYNRSGHVFQDRYKSIICQKKDYLLRLVQYIHLNPVRAGLVNNINDYKWSSHQCYIGKIDSKILSKENFFRFISEGSASDGYRMYCNIIAEGLDEKAKDEFKKSYKRCILGNDSFIKKIQKEKTATGNADGALKQLRKTLPEILVEISMEFNVSQEAMLSKNKFPEINCARKMFYYKSARKYGYSLREIACFINRDVTVINRSLKGMKRIA